VKRDAKEKLCEAALRLAAKKSWNTLTLEQIASAAKISRAQLQKIISEKNKLLPLIVDFIGERTAAGVGKINPREAAHDRLFQVMMARFDVLQDYRAGILSLFEEFRRDPSLARLILPAQIQSMQTALKIAHLELSGITSQLSAFGLLAVYYRALWCWKKDQTQDMSRTMAALAQGLRCADRLAAILLRVS